MGGYEEVIRSLFEGFFLSYKQDDTLVMCTDDAKQIQSNSEEDKDGFLVILPQTAI